MNEESFRLEQTMKSY